MGKNGRFGKMYGKVVGRDDDSRPGWKGPGYIKKEKAVEAKAKAKTMKKAPEADEQEVEISEPEVPIKLQQLLLNCFRDTFPVVLTPDILQPVLQEVKSALYERDFAKAFGKSEYLEAYAARWSPSRALCYMSILVEIREHLDELYQPAGFPTSKMGEQESISSHEQHLTVSCIGGCAAEVVAFGGFIRYLQDSARREGPSGTLIDEVGSLSISSASSKINLALIDIAEWREVTQKLQDSLIDLPPMSKYASAAAKAANSSLIAAENINTTFHLADVLSMTQSQIGGLVGSRPSLLTLLFTLNELYTASISKTTAFLLMLTVVAKPGTILLVVDSPGSYSETSVGAEAKKYPMKFLLDHTLLEARRKKPSPEDEDDEEEKKDEVKKWEKIVSDHSKWFRVPESLRYPIPLENMRYQVHIYRRL
ncbi:hypothetical protein BGZ60DRAFT_521889 [Tricladium varicosporioides]|nr:hypothetical protein BGZ60DRAFT_521889 [Hymenoscyphus varicosporioides]